MDKEPNYNILNSVIFSFIGLPKDIMKAALMYKYVKKSIKREILNRYITWSTVYAVFISIYIFVTKDLGILLGSIVGLVLSYIMLFRSE